MQIGIGTLTLSCNILCIQHPIRDFLHLSSAFNAPASAPQFDQSKSGTFTISLTMRSRDAMRSPALCALPKTDYHRKIVSKYDTNTLHISGATTACISTYTFVEQCFRTYHLMYKKGVPFNPSIVTVQTFIQSVESSG